MYSSAVSFFKRGLHSDPFQIHKMLVLFLSGGNLGGKVVGVMTLQNMQRRDLVTYDQTDADLSQAQHDSEYLKGHST